MSHRPASLLPIGLYDLLPPQAAHERYISGHLAESFEAFGYLQVSPPLMEFEATLLAGKSAAALAPQTFRVMDPKSQGMMGFRPDITLQVGRIASTRLADWPRPLRLAYGGSTLRVKGEGREGARQWRQAGIECIGITSPQADAEVIAVAVQAVSALGVKELVLDITLPGLVGLLLADDAVDAAQRTALLHAVECKDVGSVRAIKPTGYAASLPALIASAGEAKAVLDALERIPLPAAGKEQVVYVKAVIAQLEALGVPVELTLDPVENRGFEYHSLISFSLFTRAGQSELGRGGRYAIAPHGEGEGATGMTLYVNTLMDAVPVREQAERILVSAELSLDECLRLQALGYAVIRALDGAVDANAATRQQCHYIWADGQVLAVAQS